MTAQAGEHNCRGCGSVFYEDTIFELAGIWYHLDCFKARFVRTFLAYEDGGEWAIQHHKNRLWYYAAMREYLRIGGDDPDILRLCAVVGILP